MPHERTDRRVKIFLTLPRCGTHFIWSRLVESGRHQLIYDADRVPALTVLARHCAEKLSFLCPPPENPNYNFQYNSLSDCREPLTAAEHLERLSRRYDAEAGFNLFSRIMSLQDAGDRSLFSVNRFVYTLRYDFLFEEFHYTIEHAIESLRLLHEWVHRLGVDPLFVLVVREVPGWIASQFAMYGRQAGDMIAARLRDLPPLLAAVGQLGVPVYRMKDVISAFDREDYDLAGGLEPLGGDRLDAMAAEALQQLDDIRPTGDPPPQFRLGRFVQYLRERDPIKRTSLVRSIGAWPQNHSGLIPVLGRRIRADYDGLVLNNARVRPLPAAR
ncbi:MAG: hypothetical protein JXL80_09460 [Planctomycetes bacterium]|nr:hypothetical protein [Planctomycetota bacterium]